MARKNYSPSKATSQRWLTDISQFLSSDFLINSSRRDTLKFAAKRSKEPSWPLPHGKLLLRAESFLPAQGLFDSRRSIGEKLYS